ncbi:MAG: hypothetical protein Ct9H300mP11_31360 [Chloroflexota bacterium]|nr:MAG: hypothetical protein Ct9H300mP11_31360 [Chloroflexota bacterium]
MEVSRFRRDYKPHETRGGRKTPGYIAATGPKVMRVAGEVADGALLMTGIPPNQVADPGKSYLMALNGR